MENQTRKKALDSNKFTSDYFDEILMEMRHFDAVKPSTEMTLYGKTFRTPIMMAALSHIKGKGGKDDGMVQMAQGGKISGSVNWSGMDTLEQFSDIMKANSETIRIIKPYDNEKEVFERIEQAEELGALAVGMDLDHSFNGKGDFDKVQGFSMRSRKFEEIESYCKRTKLPFIIKGVISTTDAKKCLDAGIRGIVVSHHHGILPSVVPPLMILPEIAKVIDGRIPIFVDCGIMNGSDAFKALALGATAVSVGRPVMDAINKNGAEGAASMINLITEELSGVMARTCSADIKNIDSSVLWNKNGKRFFE